MAIPILHFWKNYFDNPDEGMGSSYERIVLNNKLLSLIKIYNLQSVLEAPSFGFTGLSGINSVALAQAGCQVTLIDNNQTRSDLIKKLWQDIDQKVNVDYNQNFNLDNYQDNQFDLSWNFSAMWFLDDLEKFISGFTRITRKVILICVPNQTGIGYISQKLSGKEDLKRLLNEEFIDKKLITAKMKKYKWKLVEHNYIDCPPWPDIGMSKEKFLTKFNLGFLLKEKIQDNDPLTILDYYSGKNKNFASEMMHYYWLEKFAPRCFKKFWAHHYFLIFKPE